MLSIRDNEIYQQFILLDNFGIKPWETSEDHEVYKEDLVNMIALKHLQVEAQNNEVRKTQWRAEMQTR
jgi:hypothetical protein